MKGSLDQVCSKSPPRGAVGVLQLDVTCHKKKSLELANLAVRRRMGV